MRRRLLVITKKPEFDVRGEVILGQCEPFTSGWSLVMIDGENSRQILLTGIYSDLRRIQEACRSLDTLDAVRERVDHMRAEMATLAYDTGLEAPKAVANSANVPSAAKELPRPEVEVPGPTPRGLLNLESFEGVLVATVLQPDIIDEANLLKNELLAVLDCHPKGVVMDLGGVSYLSARSFKEMAGVRDRLQELGAAFALCNLPNAVRRKLRHVKVKGRLAVYENQATALAALKVYEY